MFADSDLRRTFFFVVFSAISWGLWFGITEYSNYYIPRSTLWWHITILYILFSFHAIPANHALPVYFFGWVVIAFRSGPRIVPLFFFQTGNIVSRRDQPMTVKVRGFTLNGVPLEKDGNAVWLTKFVRLALIRAEDLETLVRNEIHNFLFNHITTKEYETISDAFDQEKYKALVGKLARWGVELHSLSLSEGTITDESIRDSLAQKVAARNLAEAETILIKALKQISDDHKIDLAVLRANVFATAAASTGNASVIPSQLLNALTTIGAKLPSATPPP